MSTSLAGSASSMRSAHEPWPISETLGVLFGVLGIAWLVDGQAHLVAAIVSALAVGTLIKIVRSWKAKGK